MSDKTLANWVYKARHGTHEASGLVYGQESGPVASMKQGQSLREIDRALGKHAGSIHGVVSSNGGFTPAVRRRLRWALTLAAREEISRGMAAALSPADLRQARSRAVDRQP